MSKRRILVYRFGQLGDTVAAIPALKALRQHFRGREIILLSETPASPSHLGPAHVLERTGLIDGFETYPPARFPSGILRTLAYLHGLASEDVEALVYLVPSIRPKLRRLRDLAVFRAAGFWRILGTRSFPDDLSPRANDGSLKRVANETDALLKRLAADDIATPAAGEAEIDLNLRSDELARAETWLAEHNLSPASGRRWFAVCPGSKWASKIWPRDNYAEVGQRLLENHEVIPVVVGGKEDVAVSSELINAWGEGHCAAGQLDVRESAALLQSASFYLGNDTGAMHLAAAVGTPCVAIFSAQDWPGRWDPYGPNHVVLRTHVECAGCMSAECPNDRLCLRSVDPDAAYRACLGVLEHTTP